MWEITISNLGIIIGIIGLYIICRNYNLKKKDKNIIILEKAIYPLYHNIAEIRNILISHKNAYCDAIEREDGVDIYKYREFILTPHVDRFRDLLVQCEIYLDNNSNNMIQEYKTDINRFFMQHMLIEDYIYHEYLLEPLSISEAYDLFSDLLNTIKKIKKRYK